MSNLTPSRYPDRGSNDRQKLYEILDDGNLVHVGFSLEESPLVIPTLYVRVENDLYIHGAIGSRWLSNLVKTGTCACLTVTHLDGWVLAKSMFAHSTNYRSAVIFATPEKISDLDEKKNILIKMTDAIIPGRAENSRAPTAAELKQTLVAKFSLDRFSTKIRKGPPGDPDKDDQQLSHWTGVLPIASKIGTPIPSHDSVGQSVPEYLK